MARDEIEFDTPDVGNERWEIEEHRIQEHSQEKKNRNLDVKSSKAEHMRTQTHFWKIL